MAPPPPHLEALEAELPPGAADKGHEQVRVVAVHGELLHRVGQQLIVIEVVIGLPVCECVVGGGIFGGVRQS